MNQRRERKPKVTERISAWALAFDSIRQLTKRGDAVDAEGVGEDAAAVAAAILVMGPFDLNDPALAVAANIIGWDRKPQQEEPDGNEPG